MQRLEPCSACGASQAQMLYPSTLSAGAGWHPGFDPYSGHYQIDRCGACGLIYASAVFSDADIAALYSGFPAANVDALEIANVKATMAGYYAMARPYLTRKGDFLDVGCDVGLLLEVAAGDGFDRLYGIELVDVARREAERKLPSAKVEGRPYLDCALPAHSFDMIAFVHVLDHLVRPELSLERAFEQLRPGGLALAVVHDIEAPLAKLMGQRYPVYNFFHHYYFSKTTLARLFEGCGFETVTVQATTNRYSLAFLIERFPLTPAPIRTRLSDWSRRLGIGRLSLTLPIGNIGIVARKPAPQHQTDPHAR